MESDERRSRFFSVMAVGNNPEALMEKYDMAKKVKPYVKYKYSNKEKMHSNAIRILQQIVNDPNKFGIKDVRLLKERLERLKKETPFTYYMSIVNGLEINNDGDAITDENPKGKWDTFRIGRNLSNPLLLKNGETSFSAKMYEIDWETMINNGKRLAERVWDITHGAEPENDQEREIAANMSDKDAYFQSFKDKQEYVDYNGSYWNYAFVDKGGWFDMDDRGDSKEWVIGFYDEFVKGRISGTDKITIYECSRKE